MEKLLEINFNVIHGYFHGKHLYMVTIHGISLGKCTKNKMTRRGGTKMLRLKHCMMQGIPFHVYKIQFGQVTHPTGSGWHPWAACEYDITDYQITIN